MVEAQTEFELLMRLANVTSDRLGRGEIEGSSGYPGNLTCRNHALVNWRVSLGIEHQLVVENLASAFSLQVEIRVLRHINGSCFVGGGPIINEQGVFVGQLISHAQLQITWIAFLFVLGQIGKFQRVLVLVEIGLASQTTLSKPIAPPCKWLSPLFFRVYRSRRPS